MAHFTDSFKFRMRHFLAFLHFYLFHSKFLLLLLKEAGHLKILKSAILTKYFRKIVGFFNILIQKSCHRDIN